MRISWRVEIELRAGRRRIIRPLFWQPC